HPCVGKQQGGVVGRHQRGATDHGMAPFGEKVEKALSDFVTCHGDSLRCRWTKLNCSEGWLTGRAAATSDPMKLPFERERSDMGRWRETVQQDIHYALRTAGKSPGFILGAAG